jgi:hypothetical protein
MKKLEPLFSFFQPMEAAEGRTAHKNGLKWRIGMASNTWKPCWIYLIPFHSGHYQKPILPQLKCLKPPVLSTAASEEPLSETYDTAEWLDISVHDRA